MEFIVFRQEIRYNLIFIFFFEREILFIFNEGINLGARIVLLFTLLFSIYHRFKDIM